ncbi:MAG: hypothetical protein RIT81_18565 [Deltaproteobacteria bacterium]
MRLTLATLLVAGIFATPATASAWNVDICLKFEVDYADRDGGDWWNSTAPKPARGILYHVLDNGWNLVHGGLTDPETGCTGALEMYDQNYKVRVLSVVQTSHANIVYRFNAGGVLYDQLVAPIFRPIGNGSYELVIENPTSGHGEDWVNVLAAAGYAIERENGGHWNQAFAIFDAACPVASDMCVHNGNIYTSSGDTDRKFRIALEMGHLVAYKRDEFTSPIYNFASYGGACDEWGNTLHDLVSREYQSVAIVNGYAHFYSAAVFNDSGENSCEIFDYDLIDYNKDGWAEFPQIRDCEGGADYLGSYCGAPTTDRATELDWLRFFWDLHTNYGYGSTKIVNVLDRANPRNWSDAIAYDRMRNAAIAEGIDASHWDSLANYNGVNR